MFQFKYNDDVIPRQPEVPLSMTTVDKLKTFGQELTELWTDEPSDKQRIGIYFAIDPKGQSDLQGHIIFYMTPWTTMVSVTNLRLNQT